jgi:type I restriction enzyme S subunit
MDAEIDALTAQLNKAKLIKQGMMQELLTGRIRLPVLETTEKATPKVIPFPTTKSKQTTTSSPKDHNEQFDDAVAFAVIVDNFFLPKYRLGRVKIYKLLYLFRRFQQVDVSGFKKKAAGPYKSEARYKGGEKIAKDNGYIVETRSKEGSVFNKGENISSALKYAENWQWQNAVKWLISKFKYKNRDELETLATVDRVVCELRETGKPVDLQSVKNEILSNKEWKPKLTKPHFSDTHIVNAINWSIELFGQEVPNNA